MNINAFSNPSGKLIPNSEGNITFVPQSLPPKLVYGDNIIIALSEADRNLSRLSGIGQLLPNPHLLITPYLKREAVVSSRIEGTQASLSDLFLYDVMGKEPQAFLRMREVRNYVHSVEMCLNRLSRGERISLELIKRAHKLLLNKVRGGGRNPGEFRQVQNFIGTTNKIEDAIFIPPPPATVYPQLKELEHFIQEPPDNIPPLVQCALIHYQFETIHPFIDGNGRIGRELITLFLCERKLLSRPLLYLSAFFEKHRGEYYDRLTAVREKSDWAGWLLFFLTAVSVQSKEAIDNIEQILELQRGYHERLRKINATQNAHVLVEVLFRNPYTTATNAAEYLNVSFPTAKSVIATLERANILQEFSKKKRNKIYVAKELLKILESSKA